MITAVILDADGVVNDGTLLSLEEDFNIPSERLQRFFREAFPDCMIGKADLKEAILPYLSEWGWEGTVDELLDYWFETGSNIHHEVWDIAKQLKDAGVPVYLATNQEKYRAQYMREEMGFGTLFTKMFVSSEMGIKKPSPEFFAYIQKDIGSDDASTLLFWDDTKENVDVAASLRIQSHQFVSIADFKVKMKGYFDFLS